MLIITNQITKTELLKEMSNSLANSENSLHLEVKSLPNFLNTAIAFTIFNYQISNFPKPVFWLSYDNSIVQFLHNCHAKFPPNFLEAQQPLLTTTNPEFSSEYLHLIGNSFENNFENLELNMENEEENIEKLEMEEKLNLQHKNYKLVENFDELNNQTISKVSDFNPSKNNSFINFDNHSNFNHTNPSNNSFQSNSQEQTCKNFSIDLENDFNKEFQELIQKSFKQNSQNSSQKQSFQNQQNDQQINQKANPKFKTQQFGRKKIDFNFPISEQLKNISEFESLSAKNLFRNNRYNQSSLIGNEAKNSKIEKKQFKFDWNLKNFFAKNKSEKNKNNFDNQILENSQNQDKNKFWSQKYKNYNTKNQQTNNFKNGFKNKFGNSFFNFSKQSQDSNNPENQNQTYSFQSNQQKKIDQTSLNFGQNFVNSLDNSNNFKKTPELVKTKKQRQKPFFDQNPATNNQRIKNKVNFQQDIFNFNSKNQLEKIWGRILTKKNTLIAAITSFSFAVIIFFFFLSFFPTQAYTLQISPIGGQNKTEFELNLQQFESQNLTINIEEKIPTTGKQKIELPKSIGKFQLVNRGNSPVYLTNGGFLAFIENKRYFHKFNPTLPSTIIIPTFNENSKMEIELEAENKGDNYNLTTNISLNITNLKGERVCDNCFAKTLEEIKNSKINLQNIVSEDDKKKLTEMIENSINKKILTEIEKISQDDPNILTNKNWYKIIDKNYQLNSEVGKPISELSSLSSFNITLWSLKKDQITKLIKEKDDKIFVVNDLKLENSTGSIEQKSFKISVNYNYLQYENLSRDEIIQELAQKPIEEVQKQLQVKYLGLQNIQKEEKGFKIPGVNPRINLNIIKNNSQNSSQTSTETNLQNSEKLSK